MKYMGSKSRIAKHIVPIIQEAIDKSSVELYIEPFVGGANVIDKITCKNKFGGDINKYLIALLNHVQAGEKLPEKITKVTYDKHRKAWQEDNSEFPYWEIGASCFLASYNGRDFSGGYAKPGVEKTKKGERYRDYYRESADNLLKQSETKGFKDCKFFVRDYREWKPKNAVVYLDPPYRAKKQYANSIDFDFEEFWDYVRKWSKNNIVFVSELEAPDDFECIWSQEVSRSIKATDKSKATEKLFLYKGE